MNAKEADFCVSDKSVQSLSLTELCESQGGFWERRRVPVSHVPLETVTKATEDPGIPVLLSQVSIVSGDESFRILWTSCMKRRGVQKQWANTTTQDMTVGTLGQNQQLERIRDVISHQVHSRDIFSQYELTVKYWKGRAVWALSKRIPLKRVHNGAKSDTSWMGVYELFVKSTRKTVREEHNEVHI